MNIAIIPARGNSKRIRNKNIINFLGKPIIYWSINAAKSSKIFDHIFVSTDNKKIAKISKKFGAKIPFLRPKNISDDETIIIKVIKHCINFLEKKNYKFKYVCCIFATAPMINKYIIKKGLNKLISGNYDFVFAASAIEKSNLRSFFFKNNKLEMLNKKFYAMSPKKLPVPYIDAGQFYWGTKNAWKKNNTLFTKNSNFVVLNKKKFNDINTLQDLKFARKIAKSNKHLDSK